jgi:hypothetical protein
MTVACHTAARSAGANMPTNARVDRTPTMVFMQCTERLLNNQRAHNRCRQLPLRSTPRVGIRWRKSDIEDVSGNVSGKGVPC